MDQRRNTALIAAAQASDALAEILRFVREGDAIGIHPFGEAEPVGKLAEALALIGAIELEAYAGPAWAEEREHLGQMVAAARRFIDGWVG